MLKELIDKAIQEGGLTYDVKNDFYPSSGFVVSINKERERIVKELTEKEVIKYIAMNYDYLNSDRYCLGIWRNEGQYYLDVVMIVEDRLEAMELAQRNEQEAIYDLENDEEIPVEKIDQFGFDDLEPINVSIECDDCNEVLLSYDKGE